MAHLNVGMKLVLGQKLYFDFPETIPFPYSEFTEVTIAKIDDHDTDIEEFHAGGGGTTTSVGMSWMDTAERRSEGMHYTSTSITLCRYNSNGDETATALSRKTEQVLGGHFFGEIQEINTAAMFYRYIHTAPLEDRVPLTVGADVSDTYIENDVPAGTVISADAVIAETSGGAVIGERLNNGVTEGYVQYVDENGDSQEDIFYSSSGTFKDIKTLSNFGVISAVNPDAALYQYILRDANSKQSFVTEDKALTEYQSEEDRLRAKIIDTVYPIGSIIAVQRGTWPNSGYFPNYDGMGCWILIKSNITVGDSGYLSFAMDLYMRVK